MKKLLLVLVLLFACGCAVDEDSGNVYIDPAVAERYENVAEGAVDVVALLALSIPWLAPFATGGAGLFAMWKRLKPKLTNAERRSDNLVWGGELLAEALDGIKEDYPETWAKIGPGIHRALKSSLPMENAIREFRHLAPKE